MENGAANLFHTFDMNESWVVTPTITQETHHVQFRSKAQANSRIPVPRSSTYGGSVYHPGHYHGLARIHTVRVGQGRSRAEGSRQERQAKPGRRQRRQGTATARRQGRQEGATRRARGVARRRLGACGNPVAR